MNTYLLFVTYHAKKGEGAAFVRELEESGAAELVRAEDGCIRYDYFFSAADPDTVLLFEEWESVQHQQIHLTQPHIAQIKAAKEKYIIDTEFRDIK